MYRLLKESHIKTVPPLPEKLQAQDLLTALRGLRLEHQHAVHVEHPISMNRRSNGRIMAAAEQIPPDYETACRNRMQHHFDPGPRSPTHPGLFFHAAPGQESMNGSRILMQLPRSFASMQYSPYECAPPAPHILVSQSHTMPSHPATSHAPSPNLGLQSGLMAPMSWPPHSSRMSPGASSLDLSRAASHQQSPPQMFTPDDSNFDHDRAARHWSWNGVENGGGGGGGGGGSGVGYLAAAPHDGRSMGLDLESIEQRGDIVAATDSGVQS